MRGKRLARCFARRSFRITPAGAGKTMSGYGSDLAVGDHPRRCGENNERVRFRSRRRGSPPQVRGKRNGGLIMRILNRITPAGAGKTTVIAQIMYFIKDHPRRCGENRKRKTELNTMIGSPPQVRGKHIANAELYNPNRITPAGAGKTPFTLTSIIRSQDHPRRCGENLS